MRQRCSARECMDLGTELRSPGIGGIDYVDRLCTPSPHLCWFLSSLTSKYCRVPREESYHPWAAHSRQSLSAAILQCFCPKNYHSFRRQLGFYIRLLRWRERTLLHVVISEDQVPKGTIQPFLRQILSFPSPSKKKVGGREISARHVN